MNLPNKITLVRLILVPVMLFLYLANFIPFHYILSAVVFIVAALTDFLDGYIARKYNLVTDTGKFLDAIADKVLTTTALLVLVSDGVVFRPFGVIMLFIIFSRDYAVDMLRLIASKKGIVIPADMLGKIKSNFQFFSIPFLMVSAQIAVNYGESLSYKIFNYIGFILLVCATIMCVISGVNYIVKNRQVFKSEKTEK